MNVNNNDFYSRSSRDIIKPNSRKYSKLSSPNNQRITSPIIKTNKTIQKYINEKLSSIKIINNSKNDKLSRIQNKPKISFKNHPNIIRNKFIISSKPKQSQKKQIEPLKKNKKFKEKKYQSNKSKSKSKDNPTNISNYKSIEHSNKSVNIFLSKKPIIKDSKESKCINSISTSSGLSFSSKENRKCFPFSSREISSNKNKKETNNFNKYDNNNNSTNNTSSFKKNNNNINNEEGKQTLEDTNRYRHNINNFNYESGSDDNMSDNKIYLKCDNYSLLTFGNSFSYSNSQRSKSTQKNGNGNGNNEEFNYNDKNKTINYCKDLIINYNSNIKNNNYVNKLKEENETLKKELKESSEQISFLKYQIKELKQNNKKYAKNKKVCSPNIWKNKNIQMSIFEKETKNELINKENDFIKFNKDSLKDLNKIIGEKNYKNCKKKIIIKRKLNINGRENKKIKNKNNSVCALERPGENIIQCISKLKI